ncbi:unnamed protein product [Mesocestoides corti]|uniref:MITF_TFEB_C_3_N domain-containing protein n=1 Tax=Mesocestoides corti TaxID=53468 RepID=A0A0R3UDZ1_MESCO|nr:unnamed protein product [Mesocestoides corti]
MHSPTLIIPQQSTSLSGFDQSHPKIPHYPPTPILQVPFNTAAMQGDQRQQICQGTSIIPAGAILFTHTPVIIPNNGMGSLNSIEVIYAPPPPPPQAMSHIHMQDPLQKQASPLLRESINMALKQNEYASRLREIVQHKIQVAKQQEELRRSETCSSLFPQEHCMSQRPNSTQISLWQRLMGHNGSTTENNTNLEGSDQQVRDASPYSSNINHKEQSSTMQALQEGQLFSAPESSSLFQRWPPRVDASYSQPFQPDGCAHKNTTINHLNCSVSNQFKSLDFSSDQNKLSDNAKASYLGGQDTASNPINGASASGDTTARRLS